jgi:hypothetical protein
MQIANCNVEVNMLQITFLQSYEKYSYLINRSWIHEEIEGIQAFPPPRCGSVEHAHLSIHGYRHDVIGKLREECTEPQEVRLTTCCALWA